MKQHGNLLKFLNAVLTSKYGRGAYNLNNGQQNPDTGYFVSLADNHSYPGVDEEIIREFWALHAEVLALDNVFIRIEARETNSSYNYSVVQLIEDKAQAVIRGISRGTGEIFDNQTQEYIDLPLPQNKGTEWQKETYARLEAGKILGYAV